MDLKAVHYAILVLSVSAMVANSVGQGIPSAAPVCHGIAAVCASLAGTLGVLSPSAVPVAPVVVDAPKPPVAP